MIKIYLSTYLGMERMAQAELAKKTGIRPATINAIYNETIERINLDHLSKICETLGCQVEDILQYIPDDEYYEHRRRPIRRAGRKNRSKEEQEGQLYI